MEGFIFFPPLPSSLLELHCPSVCGPIGYLLDKVLHLKGNCIQMLACCIWPVLHMWIRPGYISPDRSLLLPDETFLAAERGVCLMWLYRLSQTLKLHCFLFLMIFSEVFSFLPYFYMTVRHQADAVKIRCSMSSPQNLAYFNDPSQPGMSCWISFHSLNF